MHDVYNRFLTVSKTRRFKLIRLILLNNGYVDQHNSQVCVEYLKILYPHFIAVKKCMDNHCVRYNETFQPFLYFYDYCICYVISQTQVYDSIAVRDCNSYLFLIFNRLEQGSNIVTRVDSSKFRLLVNRICQNLQSSVDTKVFSEEEEEKLLISLDLTKDELSLLLDTVTSIYTQAACNVVKPSVMEAVMKDNFKADGEKVSIFTNAWITYGKGIVENLRQKSIFPTQVSECYQQVYVVASRLIEIETVNPILNEAVIKIRLICFLI